MYVITALFCVFVLVATQESDNYCPSASFFPEFCSCDEFDKSINCYLQKKKDGQIFDVKQSLKKVGDFIKNSGLPANHFDELLVLCISDAKPSLVIDENSLGFLHFRKVTFDKCAVNKLNPNAFNSNHLSIEVFNFRNNVLERDAVSNLFKAVTKLSSLHILDLSYNNIEKVPANAFKPSQTRQENLTEIDLQGNRISEIGDFAFAEVSSLEFLYLDNNQISAIKENTFAIQESNSGRLVISLNSNKLNSSSFGTSAFLTSQRPVTLDMNANGIKILDESVFKKFLFLAKRNVINIKENPIECSERNAWLVPYRTLFRYLLKLDLPSDVWKCLSSQPKRTG